MILIWYYFLDIKLNRIKYVMSGLIEELWTTIMCLSHEQRCQDTMTMVLFGTNVNRQLSLEDISNLWSNS